MAITKYLKSFNFANSALLSKAKSIAVLPSVIALPLKVTLKLLSVSLVAE
jgi:hypothetical protein